MQGVHSKCMQSAQEYMQGACMMHIGVHATAHEKVFWSVSCTQSLAAKIMPAVGASLRPKAKIALGKRTWFMDEIRMDSPELLDLAEEVARTIRRSDAPFGGIQIVATGDVAQLPPMGAAGDDGEAPAVAQLRPRRELAVESRVFGEGGVEVIVFDEVVRQRDTRMLMALSDLSVGDASEEAYGLIQAARGVVFNGTDLGVMHIFATNQEVGEWGAAGVRERAGTLAQEWRSRVRQGGELLLGDEALDPDAVKRFQGKVLFEMTLAAGERYIIGPLQEQWKISKFDYATVGEVVDVMSVDVALARVRVRFIYRQFEWRGEQRFVESFVPLMTYRARHDGK